MEVSLATFAPCAGPDLVVDRDAFRHLVGSRKSATGGASVGRWQGSPWPRRPRSGLVGPEAPNLHPARVDEPQVDDVDLLPPVTGPRPGPAPCRLSYPYFRTIDSIPSGTWKGSVKWCPPGTGRANREIQGTPCLTPVRNRLGHRHAASPPEVDQEGKAKLMTIKTGKDGQQEAGRVVGSGRGCRRSRTQRARRPERRHW